MKEEYKNNDPEKLIFRTALNDMQIEPSEKFWNTALHNIINKESALRRKQVRVWKFISAGLGLVIAAFFVYQVTLSDKVSKLEQQVGELKSVQKQLIEKTSAPVASSVNNVPANPKSTVAQPVIAANTVAANVNASGREQQVKEHSAVNNARVMPKQNTVNHVVAFQNNAVVRNSSAVAITGNNAENNEAAPSQNNTAILAKNDEPANNESRVAASSGNTGNAPGNTENQLRPADNASPAAASAAQDNSAGKDVNTAANQTATAANTQAKDVKADSSAAAADAANALPPIEQASENSGIHKMSVSAYFAPGIVSSHLHDNSGDDDVYAKDVKGRESKGFAWQAGFNIGYDIGKFTIYTGMYYNRYSYTISPTIVTAQQMDNGTVGFSVVTSSGVVNVPYNGNCQEGDSMKIHGSTTRSYICVPLQLQYMFANYKKFGFFAEAGFAVDIAASTSTTINWQDEYLQDGTASVSTIQGLQKLQFGYNFGLGANYSFGKHISVYLEPVMHGSLTPVDKNTPVSSYPLFFGCSAGLTCHF